MLDPDLRVALFMEAAANSDIGKMGFGVLRYSPNPIACVIDSELAGHDIREFGRSPRSCPIVSGLEEAIDRDAQVLVLGIAPAGGLIPESWRPALDEAIAKGLSLVNGLHEALAPRYPNLKPGQWIWDIRKEPEGLSPGTGAAAALPNHRVLMLGTDMAVGKMTAGLELTRGLRARGVSAEFLATGQIGITISGSGVPLDAIRVDFAAGAIEREVLRLQQAPVTVIEGQGSYLHPASTSPLPLTRGSCPTHLVLCHRAGQTALRRYPEVAIPPLSSVIQLCEDIAEACGAYRRPQTLGIALNTAHLGEADARIAVAEASQEVGLPCTDPVRFGVDALIEALV